MWAIWVNRRPSYSNRYLCSSSQRPWLLTCQFVLLSLSWSSPVAVTDVNCKRGADHSARGLCGRSYMKVKCQYQILLSLKASFLSSCLFFEMEVTCKMMASQLVTELYNKLFSLLCCFSSPLSSLDSKHCVKCVQLWTRGITVTYKASFQDQTVPVDFGRAKEEGGGLLSERKEL